MVENEGNNESEKQVDEQVEQEINVGECSKGKSKEQQPTSSTTIPIPPAVPFPQRLKPNKLDKDFESLLKFSSNCILIFLSLMLFYRFFHKQSFSRRS